MTHKNVTNILLILAFLWSLSSCQFKDVEVGDIEQFNLVELKQNTITLDLAARIKNKNNFSFKLAEVDLEISINKQKLGRVKKIKPVKIAKNSNKIQHLICQIEVDDVLGSSLMFGSALFSNKAKIKIEGFIKGRRFLFSKKVEVKYNKTTRLFGN